MYIPKSQMVAKSKIISIRLISEYLSKTPM